jgi:hypothetical protein
MTENVQYCRREEVRLHQRDEILKGSVAYQETHPSSSQDRLPLRLESWPNKFSHLPADQLLRKSEIASLVIHSKR